MKFEGGAGKELAQLPHNIQELQVLSCDFHVRSLVDALPSSNGLTSLIRISIDWCSGIESIWSESSSAKPTLENLEVLRILDLHGFRALAKGRVDLPPVALSSLKKLKVGYCSTLEKLFTPCMLNSQFQNLEEIEIDWCMKLEEIFSGSDLDDNTNRVNPMIVELPKLRVLSLISLPSLVRTGLLCCKSIEHYYSERLQGIEEVASSPSSS